MLDFIYKKHGKLFICNFDNVNYPMGNRLPEDQLALIGWTEISIDEAKVQVSLGILPPLDMDDVEKIWV